MLQEDKVRFSPQIRAIADRGYQGIKKLQANSVAPIKAKRGGELSALEKIHNSVVSKHRIYIEHINRYIKRFLFSTFMASSTISGPIAASLHHGNVIFHRLSFTWAAVLTAAADLSCLYACFTAAPASYTGHIVPLPRPQSS